MMAWAVTGACLVVPGGPGSDQAVVSGGPARPQVVQVALDEVLAARVPSRSRRRLTRFSAMVVGGALRCLEEAGLTDPEVVRSSASVMGTCYGEIDTACRIFEAGVGAEMSPTAFHNSVHNTPLGYLAILSGMRGPSITVSDSTLSGEECVGAALDLLQEGAATRVLVGAGDESCPSLFSPCWREGEDAPRSTARRIESGDRVTTDEGCGFLVLESADEAASRGTRILCVVEGVHRGRDLEQALRRALHEEAAPDRILLPSGLDREMDPEAAATAMRVAGPDANLGTEGRVSGYVPASGVIRCVIAAGDIASGARRVVSAGVDLDGHAMAVVLGRWQGGAQ